MAPSLVIYVDVIIVKVIIVLIVEQEWLSQLVVLVSIPQPLLILVMRVKIRVSMSHRKVRDQMKIVIDIPEEVKHKVYVYGLSLSPSDKEQLIKAIVNGIPLPKGHGRLIDAGELKKIIEKNDPLTMAGFNVRLIDINSTPTIIEADKERGDKE